MFVDLLKEINQKHIVEIYQKADKGYQEAFDQQLQKIEQAYPGGLRAYYHNALKLLKESAEGINPYENFTVGKPQGLTLSYDDLGTWEKYETIGLGELKYSCFVLVAGGLGERLGYPGIKVLFFLYRFPFRWSY